MLDFENNIVSRQHIDQVADSISEWQGPVAEQLGLTSADIAAIKAKHPTELKLQL